MNKNILKITTILCSISILPGSLLAISTNGGTVTRTPSNEWRVLFWHFSPRYCRRKNDSTIEAGVSVSNNSGDSLGVGFSVSEDGEEVGVTKSTTSDNTTSTTKQITNHNNQWI